MNTHTDTPSKERTRAILLNWRRWAWDCPKDPAEVYYYTVNPVLAGGMTAKEIAELELRIIEIGVVARNQKDRNDLFNPPLAAPVTTMTAEQYSHAK